MPTALDPLHDPTPNGIDGRRDALLIAGLLMAVHLGGAFELVAARQTEWRDVDTARLLIDPNTAPADELMLLPGIGPTLSDRIVRHREASAARPAFAAADDLQAVKRIGPVTVAKLRPFLTFADPQP